jgi:membrane protein YdbS with pleckstrin-like domain
MDQTRIDMLERLAGLFRAGNLSEEEYAAEKAKVLAGAPTVAPAAGDFVDYTPPGANAGEDEIDRFRGSTTGWLLGSLYGWGTILLVLAWPVALLASLETWPLRIAGGLSLFGLGMIVWRFFGNISASYVLTTQRLVMRTGIFFKRVDEIELYRVKDVRVDYSLVNQLTGIGRLTLRTSDQSSNQTDFTIPDVPDAVDLRETLRMLVDKARQRRGVREMDVDEWGA